MIKRLTAGGNLAMDRCTCPVYGEVAILLVRCFMLLNLWSSFAQSALLPFQEVERAGCETINRKIASLQPLGYAEI